MNSRQNIIPLFPLEKVLYPGMAMPLHIFEERYKELINLCVSERRSFGILHGLDVQQPVIGTTARVEKVLNRYDDGRMDILVVGEERFEVRQVFKYKAYLEAEVSYFDDAPSNKPEPTHLGELVRLYKLYIRRLDLESENLVKLDDLMEEVEQERELSYIIGQTIGLDLRRQQELLEKTEPMARVKLLTAILHRHDVVYGLARRLFEGQEEFDPTMN
ncbi:LON peptidase substrate-binding domain-containing protein [bacterium]|nr:LON peptidase substrate-binding domain-containing protein [bacterium]